MPYLSLFNRIINTPFTWLCAIVLFQIGFVVLLHYKLWPEHSALYAKRRLICTIIGIALFVVTSVTFVYFSPDTYYESTVDVFQVAQLNSAQIGLLEEALDTLRESEFVGEYRVEATYSGEDAHTFFWIRHKDAHRGEERVGIRVHIYDREQDAIDYIQSLWDSDHESGVGQKKRSIHENNTEAIMKHAFTSVFAKDLFSPHRWRELNTGIRIGSVLISMSETRHYKDLEDNVSNDFIRALCDVLKDKYRGLEDELIAVSFEFLQESAYNEGRFRREGHDSFLNFEHAHNQDVLNIFAESGEFEYPESFDFENHALFIAYGHKLADLECISVDYFYKEWFILSATFEEAYSGEKVFFYKIDERKYLPGDMGMRVYIMDGEERVYLGDNIFHINGIYGREGEQYDSDMAIETTGGSER